VHEPSTRRDHDIVMLRLEHFEKLEVYFKSR
jgi:hypothetical protein